MITLTVKMRDGKIVTRRVSEIFAKTIFGWAKRNGAKILAQKED